ncbi:hypothetical protein AB6A40_011657, partial [Gnathostoma spinigerum]
MISFSGGGASKYGTSHNWWAHHGTVQPGPSVPSDYAGERAPQIRALRSQLSPTLSSDTVDSGQTIPHSIRSSTISRGPPSPT